MALRSTLFSILLVLAMGRGWLANHFNFCFVFFLFTDTEGAKSAICILAAKRPIKLPSCPSTKAPCQLILLAQLRFWKKVVCHYCDNWQRIQRSPSNSDFSLSLSLFIVTGMTFRFDDSQTEICICLLNCLFVKAYYQVAVAVNPQLKTNNMIRSKFHRIPIMGRW